MSTKPKTTTTPRAKKTKGDASDEPAPRDKVLILIVDDVPDNRDIYADFLRFKGFDIVEAKDGFEAVALADQRLPDVILMDLSLPGMDGWEAARRIKANPKTQHIKIVAVTGHALEGMSKGAREAGCDGFLAKPCLPATLEAEIRKMLESSKPRVKAPRARS